MKLTFGAGGFLVPLTLCLSVFAQSCVSQGRFKDQPIVWAVDDSRDIARPAERPFDVNSSGLDWFLARRSTRALELRNREPAHNINALGEVPDSSWFENRLSIRSVSPEEAARGPSAAGPPVLPLQVIAGKPGGRNPGLVARDATGRRFIVKFDTKENPEMQTATGVIVNRIFWTLGYHVPNDSVFRVRRVQLSVAPGAMLTDEMDRDFPMKETDVDEVLALSPRSGDGSYRAFASEFVPGPPVGGFSPEGTRPDDSNDVIPHEHRREVRGLRVFCAWLNHSDMKEDNTLDAYVEMDGRHFLRHYLIDFGEAFGSHGAEQDRPEDGYEHWLDWSHLSRAALTFGLWKRAWENRPPTKWLSVGNFGADHFDPRAWKESYPFWPFWETDDADAYWAAKIIMRFDRAMLLAVVREGQLSHPEAEAYLVDVLERRKEIVGRTYLEAVSPLDYFRFESGQLCGLDLSVHHGLVAGGLIEALDDQDNVVYDSTVSPNGGFCLRVPSDSDYRLMRLRVRRGFDAKPVMQVHFKGGPEARVVGIIRLER